MGNDFRQAIGNLDWKFKVEEIPVPTETEPDTGTPSTEAPSVPDDNGEAPDTGDSAWRDRRSGSRCRCGCRFDNHKAEKIIDLQFNKGPAALCAPGLSAVYQALNFSRTSFIFPQERRPSGQ